MPFIFSIFIVCILGLCLGSFATALIYRIPRNIPWIGGSDFVARSNCHSCGHTLGILDLVPLFSWLLLKGRCRYCKVTIPSSYPLTEAIVTVLVLALFLAWGGSWLCLPMLLAVPFLFAAAWIDWKHMILPDSLNISLAILALANLGILWWQSGDGMSVPADRILAAVLLTLVFFAASFALSKWKGRRALGMGDLKFLPSAGLFLGCAALPSYMVLSGLSGLVFAAVYRTFSTDKTVFPFGPALIFSLYIHLFLTGLGFDYTW